MKYNQDPTLVMGKFGCLVNMAALLLGCLGGSVLKVYLAGTVKKKCVTSGFRLIVMLGGYICI